MTKIMSNLDLNGLKIVNSGTPTSPNDLATKQYVDANSGGGGGIIPYAEAFMTSSVNVNSSTTSWANLALYQNQTLRGDIEYIFGYYVVNTAGIYQVDAQVKFNNAANGYRALRLYSGESQQRTSYTTSAGHSTVRVSASVYIDTGQAVGLAVQQNSGAALGFDVSDAGNNFVTIARIGS